MKKCKMTIYKKINKKIRLCSSRAVLVSGNANNGTAAGLAYANTNNAASNANANIGSRLRSENSERTGCKPWHLPKNYFYLQGIGSIVEGSL